MPFLSVIIPVYKVEKYLNRCVDSVLNQNFKDVEVILVDDGSPDGCPAICDEYAQKDDRVKVIHKKNGGLSSARNAGIEIAQGEYLAFLDSDDAWAENKLGEVMKHLQQANVDMLLFSSCDELEDGRRYQRKDSLLLPTETCNIFNCNEYYSQLIKQGNLRESACTKIIKAEFIKEFNLYFQPGIISEDTEWMFRVLRTCQRIAVIDTMLFVCTYGREGSISNTAGVKSVESLLQIIEQSLAFSKGNNENETSKYELMHCAYLLSIVVGIYGGLNKIDKKRFKEQIKTKRFLLKLNKAKKVRLVRICWACLGLSLTAKILNKYIQENKKRMLNREEMHG